MCLAKRIQPCKYCCDKLEIEESVERTDAFMELGFINEGVYLKNMNRAKECFEMCERLHKEEGCQDCLEDDGVDDDDDDDTIEVEEFYWNHQLYYRTDDGILFSGDGDPVGSVVNGLVTIF